MKVLMSICVGFVLGGHMIGTGLSQRVNQCVATYSQPCTVEQTLTGVKVRPTPSQTERE